MRQCCVPSPSPFSSLFPPPLQLLQLFGWIFLFLFFSSSEDPPALFEIDQTALIDYSNCKWQLGRVESVFIRRSVVAGPTPDAGDLI